MRRIYFEEPMEEKPVPASEVANNTPIFAYRSGRLAGMVVLENDGWITRIGGNWGVNGHYKTREECIRNDQIYGYVYYTV